MLCWFSVAVSLRPRALDAVIGLCALSLLLGLRHGFDPDHLTVIDGLTRRSFATRPGTARLSGIFFSLGHDAVVVCAAFAAVALASRWTVPPRLEFIGTAISAAFLFGLGAVNLQAAWRTPPDEPVHLHGLRSALFLRATRGVHPLAIVGVGMLFAISFDTLAQAAAISLAAEKSSGDLAVAVVIGCYALGMLTTGGLNGLWVAHLIGAASRAAAVASRIMTLAVGLLSVSVGVLALTKLAALPIGDWGEAHATGLGAAVIVVLATVFALAIRAEPALRHSKDRSDRSAPQGGR